MAGAGGAGLQQQFGTGRHNEDRLRPVEQELGVLVYLQLLPMQQQHQQMRPYICQLELVICLVSSYAGCVQPMQNTIELQHGVFCVGKEGKPSAWKPFSLPGTELKHLQSMPRAIFIESASGLAACTRGVCCCHNPAHSVYLLQHHALMFTAVRQQPSHALDYG
jgi:hypothetical protein